MKPWREVAKPHADVLAGTFVQSDFAVDIMKVVDGSAPDEYRNPEAFYERTYVTEGMKQLLVTVAQRLNGRGGDPVIELKTNFGGGKSHTLLAVYHLAKYEGGAANLPGMGEVLAAAQVENVPHAKVAVIDGNALAPNQPLKQGGLSIRTIWGNLAWQLLGPDGYAKVAESDAAGTSPGKTILESILREAGPCVILMDELAAYYRQFGAEGSLTGGTYESNVSFAQALTEAVKGVPQAMLLVSLPSSDTEAAGSFGRQALDTLEKTFGRVNAIWRPVSAEEGFEIVKRRLFEKIDDAAAVEETCQAFASYYHEKRDSLPSMVQEGGWIDKMRQCYPIHPEVFIRLYEDWSTLQNFQKTRGVLQYMAIVINSLWKQGTDEPLIMPASIPLCDTAVANKSTQFLPNGWGAIIDREIDGEQSQPVRIDGGDPHLGNLHATVRAARTIFLGSAASTTEQAVRGISRKQILLGCAMPGQELSFYEDALHKMRERLQYLFNHDERYWYDTRPNLTRTMNDYKGRVKQSDARDCLEMALKAKWGVPGCIAGVHVFEDHGEVSDDIADGIRVVVLPLNVAYSKATEKRTFDAARKYVAQCGTVARMRKNRIVFVAADLGATGRIEDQCRTMLAWRAVKNAITEGAINVTKQEEAQVTASYTQSETMLKGLIGDCFKYLLVPEQVGNDVGFIVRKLSVANVVPLGDVVRQTLENNDDVVRAWAPQFMRDVLEQYYFKDGVTEVSTRKVWNDMGSYLYFPRLVSASVFCETVRQGVAAGHFGYARGKTDDGKYAVFAYGENRGMPGVSESELIVKDTAAEAYKATLTGGNTGTGGGASGNGGDGGNGGNGGNSGVGGTSGNGNGTGSVPVQPPTAAKRKFVGEVCIDTSNGTSKIAEVVDEVISHLSGIGANVKVTLTVEAKSVNPFAPNLTRTIGENAHNLGFVRAEFS